MTVGLGALIAASGHWPAVALGAGLAIAGAVGFGPLIIPWRVDGRGIHRGRRTVLLWPEITAVEVRDFRTRRGLGPPHVDVVLRGPERRAVLSLYSRHDAGRLQQRLCDYLAPDVDGRGRLPAITDAWNAMN